MFSLDFQFDQQDKVGKFSSFLKIIDAFTLVGIFSLESELFLSLVTGCQQEAIINNAPVLMVTGECFFSLTLL